MEAPPVFLVGEDEQGGGSTHDEDELPMDRGDADSGSDGAAGSNPLAAVSKVDFIWQYFDLTSGRDVHDFNAKGSTMLHPRVKLNLELHYWATDVTGSNERDWESLSIKPIWFVHDRPLGETWGFRLAAGAEYIVDFNHLRQGIGMGSDQFGPLVGFAFMNRETKTVLIPLIQHFEDVGSGAEISTTALRVIALQPLPGAFWAKADAKFPRDWEQNEWPANGELEFGKMFTPNVGLFTQGLAGLGGERPYDWGTALRLRVNF